MGRSPWCLSAMRIPAFLKRQRRTRRRNKVRQGPGKAWLQVRRPIKHDGRCSPKTKQTNKHIRTPKIPSLFYQHFCLYHSTCLKLSTLAHCFTLLSLSQVPCLTFSCSVFCLPFASQDTRRRTQNVIFTFLFVVESTAAGWHLPSPSSLNFPFMFTPRAIPLFHALMCFCHNINKPTACRVLCSPSVPVWLENHLLWPVPLRPRSAQKGWKTDRNCELCWNFSHSVTVFSSIPVRLGEMLFFPP